MVASTLLQIAPRANAVVRDADGAPVLLESSKTDCSQRLARNTKYVIHPEEVLADNHALLVRRRLGSAAPVADAVFLYAFEECVRTA